VLGNKRATKAADTRNIAETTADSVLYSTMDSGGNRVETADWIDPRSRRRGCADAMAVEQGSGKAANPPPDCRRPGNQAPRSGFICIGGFDRMA
jgi:hypothetical protein